MAYKDPPKEYQFKPGQSGNPKGKQKGTLSIKKIIRDLLSLEEDHENPVTKSIEKMNQAEIITLKQIAKARKGDSRAFELLKNHIEALPKQGIDLTTAGESLNGKEIVFRRYKKDDSDK